MLKYKKVYETLLRDTSSFVILNLKYHLSPKDVVLDIGSAQGHLSSRMLNFVNLVYCYDISQSANKKRAILFPSLVSIKKLDDIQKTKYKEISIVTLISVIQYMELKEIDHLFSLFQKQGVSKIILGDVDNGVSKSLSALSALKNIFFNKGLFSTLNLLMFYYYKVIFAREFPSSIALGDLEKICQNNGFDICKVDNNIGLCNYKSTFICTQS
jgi:hypothetical protein